YGVSVSAYIFRDYLDALCPFRRIPPDVPFRRGDSVFVSHVHFAMVKLAKINGSTPSYHLSSLLSFSQHESSQGRGRRSSPVRLSEDIWCSSESRR
ncbi:hypothetical protein PFISCL1PPCAC_22629, partial [Pristionchus fissidentatus]